MANKIIVGVHGIGDQVQYETIQAITYQFCRFYKIQTAVPLGGFYNSTHNGIVVLQQGTSNSKLYFTEAYWADIARKPETDGYVLEETKHWAKTIVERFRAQVKKYKNQSSFEKNNPLVNQKYSPHKDDLYLARGNGKYERVRLDYRMIRSVLYEAIDTVDVLEKLLFILGKIGIFQFNLNSVLTNYLGDVQVVAEFEKYRTDILERFIDSITNAYKLDKDADIYVVAHSEGTVISFLALLEVMKRGEKDYPWISNVKGFMTIGSPIDKHLTLWPELWEDYKYSAHTFSSENQIQWRNYYDYGDPVGYELDSARVWIKPNCTTFNFSDAHDFGFSRYFLPGKAHIDYWKDDAVFDNFIGGVVEPQTKSIVAEPKDKLTAKLVCNVVPYLGIATILSFAVYFLYKPIYNSLLPCWSVCQNMSEGTSMLIGNVAGIAAILSGITIMARIPRLSRKLIWYAISICLFFAFEIASSYLLAPNVIEEINSSFFGVSYIAITGVVTAFVTLLGAICPPTTSKPLVFLGGLAVLWSAFHIVLTVPNHPSIWPLFVGGAIFIYGWWLAIQLFDLIFIWHWYIRNSKALERLRDIRAREV